MLSPRFRPLSYRQQARADSITIATTKDTIYKRRLSDLIRRSLLVPTDGLARLYASAPSTSDSELYILRQEIGCEELRLLMAHGQAATLRATSRMADSLVRSGFDVDFNAGKVLAAKGPNAEIRNGSCGVFWPHPRLPDSLNYEVYPTRYMRKVETTTAPAR
jgi:hypothetical protein